MGASKLVLVVGFASATVALAARTESVAPAIGFGDATSVLFGSASAPPECTDVDCLISHRYASDDAARRLALQLHQTTGDVAGLGLDEVIDGGYRGMVHLVPQLPIGRYRRHLTWVISATRTIDTFFADLYASQPAPHFRWRSLGFEFVRSVGMHTPSAYASGWNVVYNVDGSMMTSADTVTETVFHELFHDNDEDHGGWSERVLEPDYDAILARCGARRSCLAPYAPNSNVVTGGTFYAFQQNNGASVREYGAELAVRYFKEQTEMLQHHKLAHPAFKCGPAENARAWDALVDEFFAGRDLVPPCELPAGPTSTRRARGGTH